ncbi:MAG: hypothetical protein O6939_09105 [Bacteroidetes bacterium]|nr:hypothetical protein [Bacteroidota bacterium]
MKIAHLSISVLLIFTGIIHLITTYAHYDTLTFNSLWFFSGGLWGIFLGYINILAGHNSRRSKINLFLWHSANILSVVFVIMGYTLMPGWQSAFAGFMVVSVALVSLLITFNRFQITSKS